MRRYLLVACLLAANSFPLAAFPKPLIFEEWPTSEGVDYRTALDGGSVRLTSHGIAYLLNGGKITMVAPATTSWRWMVTDALDAQMHVFSGAGIRHSPLATHLVARNIYPGIDISAHGSGSEFEYDFVVHPNADPNTIALRFDGARRVRLKRGELYVEHTQGILRQQVPVAYQEIHSARSPVEVSYRLDRGLVRFDVKRYDRRYPLIIDPVVAWAAGGPQRSALSRIALGRDGSIYAIGSDVAASESTARFGTEQGIGGYSLVKLRPGGAEIAYVVHLAASVSLPNGLAVDSEGCAYVAGWTNSTRYPITSDAFQTSAGDLRRTGTGDGFLTKFSSDGSSLVYSTLLGGAGDDRITGLAIDEQENAYVTGNTSSRNFPTTMGSWRSEFEQVYRESDHSYWGASDAFLLQFNNTGGAIVRSTVGLHVLLPVLTRDAAGDLYVAGSPHYGFDHDVSEGARVSLGVMKFTRDLSRRVWVNGFGGNGTVQTTSLAVNAEGQLLVAGHTNDSRFPTTPGAFQQTLRPRATPSYRGVDSFLLKMLADGSGPAFSTLLGGTGDDSILGVASGSDGSIHVAGATTSSDFPVTADALQPRFGGGVIEGDPRGDGFYARFSPDGSKLEAATYMGGTSFLDRLESVALDPADAVYLGGWVVGGAAVQALSGPPQWQAGPAALLKITAEAGSEPRLTELVPNRLSAGSAAASIQVIGENFRPDAALLVEDVRIPVSVDSPTLLLAQVPAELMERVRELNVRVINPGMSASNALSLTVASGESTGKPYLRSIRPTSIVSGSPGVQLKLSGSGFDTASTISWRGELRTPESITGGEAILNLTAADLLDPGSFSIAITGPGGDSNPLSFTVSGELPPAPGPLLSIFPAGEAVQGAPEKKATFTITSSSITATVDGATRPLQHGFLDREWDITLTAEDHRTVGMRELKLVDQATGKVSNAQPYFVALPLESRFLAFNPLRKVLYVAPIPRTGPEDFVVLDGKDFTRLSSLELRVSGRPLVSGDGRFVYVPYSDAVSSRWRRLETLNEAPWLRMPGEFLEATSLGVIPGLPDTVLLARSQGSDLVVEILDGAVRRPQSVTLRGRGGARPEVFAVDSTSAWLLFGSDGSYVRLAIRLSLGAQGVEGSEVVASEVWAGLSQASTGGLIFTRSGLVLEPGRLNPVARFPAATRGPIAAGGRIAFVSEFFNSSRCLLTVVDPDTVRPEWSILGGSDCYNIGDLVALDGDRFAWISFGKIYVVKKPSAFSSPEPEVATQPGSPVSRIDLVREAGVSENLFYYLWTGRQPAQFLPYLVQKGGPVDRESPIRLTPTADAPGSLRLTVLAPPVPGLWAGDLHFTIPNSVAPVKTMPITLETIPIFPLRIEPAALEFQVKPNTPASPARIHISKDGAPFSLNYSITYATQPGNWLSIRYVDRGQTPLDLDFVVAAGNLAAGEYKANVQIGITDGPATVIPVTLRIER